MTAVIIQIHDYVQLGFLSGGLPPYHMDLQERAAQIHPDWPHELRSPPIHQLIDVFRPFPQPAAGKL